MSIESILSPPSGACQSPRALDSRARAMDGAVHTAAAEQSRVRRVHNGVHFLLGDVTFNHRASGFKPSRPLEAARLARRLPPRRQELALERRAPVQEPRSY